jgi:hypothetical protein
MKFGQGLLNDREESGRGGKATRKHSGRGMEGNEDAPSFLPNFERQATHCDCSSASVISPSCSDIWP